jgi:LysM repeat protein
MPYKVMPGDTLNSIARRFGINLVGLIDLNPTLRLRTLTEGMVICVPSVPESPPCINGAYYIVQAGDSFFSLSKKYSIPLNILLEANPSANPYDLKVGQELCIPNVPSNCPFGVVVTIQPGTRLSDILITYNLSINELLESNTDFNPNIIVPGNELCIPPGVISECDPATSTEYIIKEGESLASVASKFNVTPSELLITNPNMRPANFLIVGTRVCVPVEKNI